MTATNKTIKGIFSGALALAIAMPAALAASAIVVDGDTVKIGEITYRLHGIDAPEAGQKCNKPGSGQWRCGDEATGALRVLVADKAVKCDDRGQGGFGRTLAVCTAGGLELNDTMVRRGMAWAFRSYSADYVAAEDEALKAGLGIWQAPTETAEIFRARRWKDAEQEAPKGCPIKGNISRNGRIYHAPWSPWYKRTKVSLDKGERWFCSEREAINAGWRAPIWGN